MRRLILEEWMSLDGFVTDKNGQLNFFTNLTPEQNKYSDNDQLKFLETIDTILLGRKTYELFVDFWPSATTDKEIIAYQVAIGKERKPQLTKLCVSRGEGMRFGDSIFIIFNYKGDVNSILQNVSSIIKQKPAFIHLLVQPILPLHT